MIRITVYRREGAYRGLRAAGHAEYDDPGRDIICASVSTLIVNTLNSIEKFTDDPLRDESAEDGLVNCYFPKGLGEKGTLLMDSLLLGLRQLAELRGEADDEPYVELLFEEVKEDAESESSAFRS